jgi:hypothetical protein
MQHIIETIGKWGVKTTPVGLRMTKISAGDVVQFPDEHKRYPVSYRRCRIDRIDREKGMVGMVDGMGSAFITESGSLSISGGPFFSLPIECLTPMHCTHTVHVWNWGDNSPGAGQGVDYHIERPLFEANASPSDYAIRYSRKGEQGARQGGEYNHGVLAEIAKLVRTWEEHDGLTGYLFDVRAEAARESGGRLTPPPDGQGADGETTRLEG